ncbi:MAG: hypothetical protein KA113_15730 [Syntrophaceae bacterium]|nr:hypothetical protein [Syntrophaceae bacterium]
MITDENKKRIESLSTEEMLYEINLGRRSRFQRDKFAYLQTCYQLRLEEEKQLASKQSMANPKTSKKPNNPHNTSIVISGKSIEKGDKWHETVLGKIAIGVIIFIISWCVVWVINHYLNLNLTKP